jgi:hypothetical protein
MSTPDMHRGPVTQLWTHGLTWMQQSVLITAVRGPDGIHKDHVSKLLIRWLRRCVLLSAFDGRILPRPYDDGPRQGGSFTGASLDGPGDWQARMHRLVGDYLRTVDELPHHFQLHFMHAAEILGYKHPDPDIRPWWHECYLALVNDMHLAPEDEDVMDRRLGDHEADWRAAELVVAAGPREVRP